MSLRSLIIIIIIQNMKITTFYLKNKKLFTSFKCFYNKNNEGEFLRGFTDL